VGSRKEDDIMIVMEVLAIVTAVSIFLTAAFGGFEHYPKDTSDSRPTTTQENSK